MTPVLAELHVKDLLLTRLRSTVLRECIYYVTFAVAHDPVARGSVVRTGGTSMNGSRDVLMPL